MIKIQKKKVLFIRTLVFIWDLEFVICDLNVIRYAWSKREKTCLS
jgi:hypothetical protein